MKTSKASKAPAKTGAKSRELVAKISLATKRAEATRKTAQAAKADFKRVRKNYKHVKKAAKAARRELKALKKALAAAKAAARKKTARTRKPLQVRKSTPMHATKVEPVVVSASSAPAPADPVVGETGPSEANPA